MQGHQLDIRVKDTCTVRSYSLWDCSLCDPIPQTLLELCVCSHPALIHMQVEELLSVAIEVCRKLGGQMQLPQAKVGDGQLLK